MGDKIRTKGVSRGDSAKAKAAEPVAERHEDYEQFGDEYFEIAEEGKPEEWKLTGERFRATEICDADRA